MDEPMMIPCDRVVARLWEYVDGELEPASAAEISAHLDMCARCFPHYDFQRAYREFVRRTRRQDVPAGLRRRVFESILAEESVPAPRTGWIETVRRWFRRGSNGPPGRH